MELPLRVAPTAREQCSNWTSMATSEVLHSFSGEKGDGAGPVGGLVLQENQTSGLNNLYGTTSGGGVYTWGTVFKLTPATKTALTSCSEPLRLWAGGDVYCPGHSNAAGWRNRLVHKSQNGPGSRHVERRFGYLGNLGT